MTLDESHSEGLNELDDEPIHNNSDRYIPRNSAEKLSRRPQAEKEEQHTFTMLSMDDRKDSHAEHLELVFRRRVAKKEAALAARLDQCAGDLILVANTAWHVSFAGDHDRLVAGYSELKNIALAETLNQPFRLEIFVDKSKH